MMVFLQVIGDALPQGVCQAFLQALRASAVPL
jgi:hypothetical protein